MPKYSWTIEIWSALDGIATEKLTANHAASLYQFEMHDVLSALKGEIITDYIEETPVVFRLVSVRSDKDGDTFAIVKDRKLPTFYSRIDKRDGCYVHRDVHDELERFCVEHAGMLAVTGDDASEIAAHVD
jgi:hypothetical protein